MTTSCRTLLAIAVEPPLLGSCIVHILGRIGVDEVVNLKSRGIVGRRSLFDAVVTSESLIDKPGADVVIELPDKLGNAGVGRVSAGEMARYVLIDSSRAILEILDRYCPERTGLERATVTDSRRTKPRPPKREATR